MPFTSNIWYLAYGSNLSSKVFQGRRGVRPLDQRCVCVPDFELVFDLAGIPYFEPTFANIRRKKTINGLNDEKSISIPSTVSPQTPELMGVAYLLTPDDYRKVLMTEGAGSSYQEVTVECEVLPQSGNEKANSEPRITAYTLLAPPGERRKNNAPLQPSRRYINIIRTGAREKNLPEEYIAYLDSVAHYERTSLRQRIGGILYLLAWITPLMSLLVLTRIFADQTGRMPPWLLSIQKRIFQGAWWSYEWLLKPIFGNGEITEGTRKYAEVTEEHNIVPETAKVDLAVL